MAWVSGWRETERDQASRERQLGALLEWCASGTLGARPAEEFLARHGLDGSEVLVAAFPRESHELVHRRAAGPKAALGVLDDVVVTLDRHTDSR